MTDPKETFTSAAATEWQPSRFPGVSRKVLRSEVFVLEGDVRIGRHHMKAGDYLYTPPDAKHAAASDRGCVFLVTLPKPVVMLKDA